MECFKIICHSNHTPSMEGKDLCQTTHNGLNIYSRILNAYLTVESQLLSHAL